MICNTKEELSINGDRFGTEEIGEALMTGGDWTSFLH